MATTRILEWLGRFYIVLLLGFLYLPIIIMAAMSFNASPFYQLPFEWTTDWYASLWQNDQLIAATWNSIEIAVITTLISTLLGSMASLALYRYEFRGKK
ncbi:MAG: ABC transporter permease, partial [Mesorhizobium sp.]